MEEFRVGDTVVLKSGGPIMTIVDVGGGSTDWIACSWYEGKKFNTEQFPPPALRLAEASDSAIGVA
jgi:uncharacterized protein YodC (DUF2158 family)